jgi:beta-glucanase (GH16 family)
MTRRICFVPVLSVIVAVCLKADQTPAVPQAQPARPAAFVQSFTTMDDVRADWTMSSWTNTNRSHSPANVTVTDGVLHLKLSATTPGEKPVCAEVVSRRTDFHHGTYRASIKMTSVPGAVAGWFTYLGKPLNEIDVEFLSRDPGVARFTLHHIKTGVDHGRQTLAFDPTADFHEYRFDWYPDRVEYYIDGQPSAVLRNDVPDRPSRLLLNHWSGNIPTFGGLAPTEDAVMQVDWVYYSPDYQEPMPGSLQ